VPTSRRSLLAAAALAPWSVRGGALASEAPKTLRAAFPVAETGFDPVQSQDLYSGTINAHIFEAPLEYDFLARPPRLQPNTAAALLQFAADFRMLTLRIRPGIFFADDPAFRGSPRELTAHDYVYSCKRIFDPRWKSQNLYLLKNARILGIDALRKRALAGAPFDDDTQIEGLRAPDRYTLQIRMAEPNPRFIYNLSPAQPMGAVAREVVEAYGDAIVEHPVGTGPFRVVQWRRSSRIVLERNPNYRHIEYDFEPPADDARLAAQVPRLRGRQLPLVDRVEVSIIEESQPRWLAFQQGKLDLLPVPIDFNNVAAPGGRLAPHLARKGVALTRAPLADSALSYFNMEHPLVGGYTPERVALRRAVSLAFDGEDFVQRMYQGNAIVAQAPFVPGTFGYDPQRVTPISEFNRARAQALLDTYGYLDRDGDGWREQPDRAPLILEMASTATQLDRKRNELWKRYLDAVGLRIEFRVAQWPQLLKQSLAGKLMMWGFGRGSARARQRSLLRHRLQWQPRTDQRRALCAACL
jgi:ABC-type transport system substrate-binding protein